MGGVAHPSSARRRATVAGLLAAIAIILLTMATVGAYLAFATAWSCVSAHSSDPQATGCSPAEVKLRLAAVLAACLLPGWPTYLLARRRALRRRPG
jgi:hypothetical protein